MNEFREGKVQYLIATDVAARGVDVEGVTHVFNYDIPQDAESYIHRIGRTGRAGEAGVAITFIAPKDRGTLAGIESILGGSIKRLIVAKKIKTPVLEKHSHQGVRKNNPRNKRY